ncbi:MAG: alpha-galactosidase, partial [Lachnospiraceae bacterium]|nr:alpha-galactosidase [Lachnospiraceae bacterium]
MKKATYHITIQTDDGLREYSGSVDIVSTRLIIKEDLPAGIIRSCELEIPWGIDDDERFYLNGYQTWTGGKPLSLNSKERGLQHAPGFLIRKLHLDRYGDLHFTNYPYQEGYSHGFSFGYFYKNDLYRLVASNDETNGYTVLIYESYYNWGIGYLGDGGNQFGRLTLQKDCVDLVLDVPCSFTAFDLYIGEGSCTEVFDGWFDAMGMLPRTTRRLKGYTSWYNRYEKISEQSILSDLEGCTRVLSEGDLFQVDDGWETNVGDWLSVDKAKFPHGIKYIADAIHEKGFLAGLWLSPFVCNTKSSVFREHPEWLLKVSGAYPDWHMVPHTETITAKDAPKRRYTGNLEKDTGTASDTVYPWYGGVAWGGFVSLDFDDPEVIAYLEKVFSTVFDEWGFDMVKLDYLYGAAPFGTPAASDHALIRETRGGRMCRAIDLLRRLCGSHMILGCGVPVWPAFGKVEYCRVSCDVTLNWDGAFYRNMIGPEKLATDVAIATAQMRQPL